MPTKRAARPWNMTGRPRCSTSSKAPRSMRWRNRSMTGFSPSRRNPADKLMPHPLDETHDAARRSFVGTANDPATDFPIQNLPLGVFSGKVDPNPRIGVAIGDQVFDLKRASGADAGFTQPVTDALQEASLNRLFSLGHAALRDLRRKAADMLDQESSGDQVRRHASELLT